ncbi:hypothetical protein CMO90_04505 [Candidatus Woesearchaeota archaeon]|jgi:tRNA (guanine26-N2/guanine27-N2)-dimethyltransferase|nr:hypothetical protein [Candidatus Woesearchaeota archaeon]
MSENNELIQEGKAKIRVSGEKKVSKKLPVFYNSVMKLNRDISILLLNCVKDKDLRVALPLAGSGIRGLRFLLELKKNKIKTLYINDYKEEFFSVIKTNFLLNNLPVSEIILSNEDANIFLLNNCGFDYIDIDPFGTPNPFLNSTIRRVSRKGIIAITATDTSSLCGTYENACKRKYWAVPLRNELKHEIGLRILIRKVQLIGSQFDKALTPIFSYSKDHYFRVFFKCRKSKSEVDRVLKKHAFFFEAGPVWIGQLWDESLVEEMYEQSDIGLKKFLSIIKNESNIKTVGFHDIHKICEELKVEVPKFDFLSEKIKKAGFNVSRTHFSGVGLRSDISKEKLIRIIKKHHETTS